MQTTIDLLNRALSTAKSERELARTLNLSTGALGMAKKRGRVSPTIAAQLAARVGEPVMEWTCIAAIEAEPDAPGVKALRQFVSRIRNS
jgi:hypothetical protein